MKIESQINSSLWSVIKNATKRIILISVGYFTLRNSGIINNGLFKFLLIDIGFLFVLFAPIKIIHSAVKEYGNDNPFFSLGKGIKIGFGSAFFSFLVSFPVNMILANALFTEPSAMGNTIGILGFPLWLLAAGLGGALIGLVSGFFVK